MKQEILVIQLARLGDLVQSIPLIMDLKDKNNHITILCQSKLASLARKIKGIDEVISLPWDDVQRNFDYTQFYELFKKKYSIVFNLNHSLITALIAKGLCNGEVVGNLFESGMVKRNLWLDFVRCLCLNRKFSPFNLVDVFRYLVSKKQKLIYPMINIDSSPYNKQSPFIVFLLGAGAEKRRWPLTNFIQLSEILKKDFKIVLVGSKGEKLLSKVFSHRSKADFMDLVGKLDLLELCKVLKSASLVIGSDTGPLHLAAVLGVRTLGLFFGPAWVHETGPYGNGHFVFQVEMPCSPCLDKNPCRHYSCRKLITPELVASKVYEIIDKKQMTIKMPDFLNLYVSHYDGKTTHYLSQKADNEQAIRMFYRDVANALFGILNSKKIKISKWLLKEIENQFYLVTHDFLLPSNSMFIPLFHFLNQFEREERKMLLNKIFNHLWEKLSNEPKAFSQKSFSF